MKSLEPIAPVSFDERSFFIHGSRRLLVSGEIHYPRIPRAEWSSVLDESVACGINCISTYVFWNLHEPAKDRFDFHGDKDLGHFLDLCREKGLVVILRVGPYVCAEWNYGGFPYYLRECPDIEIRTYSVPYLERVERYFKRLAEEILPRLATRGGAVALVQVENEYDNVARRYGANGARYLEWMAQLAIRCGIDVPTITCEGADPEAASCRVGGTVGCVNGFSIPAERIEALRRHNPGQPVMWTELWTGWYDTWGREEHRREARNIVCSILDFVGNGGSGWSYYMWCAGTNFGRQGMYLQTPRYGLDAPLDEAGRITEKAELLAGMHKVLGDNTDLLFEGERSKKRAADGGTIETVWRLGKRELRLMQTLPRESRGMGRSSVIRGRAILADSAGQVLFDSDSSPGCLPRRRPGAWEEFRKNLDWKGWKEPLPSERNDAVVAPEPIEQLSLTKDLTDYCWYSAWIDVGASGDCRIEIPFGADFFHMWIDGRRTAYSVPPFRENRGPSMPEDPKKPRIVANILDRETGGFSHSFVIRAAPGKRRLDILSCALGLIKGDWQIAGPMATERKGIWQGVLVDGSAVKGWEMRPGLVGEQSGSVESLSYVRLADRDRRPCAWYQAQIEVAETAITGNYDFRIDAIGLGKGALYWNGRMLSRHWLIRAEGYGPDEGWQDKALFGLRSYSSSGITQRYYHLPRSWLKAGFNCLSVFDEHEVDLDLVRIEIRSAYAG